MFSYVRLDSRVPPDHPLRVIRRISDAALSVSSDQFAAMYSQVGRPSVRLEKLLRALLIQAPNSVRSERDEEVSTEGWNRHAARGWPQRRAWLP